MIKKTGRTRFVFFLASDIFIITFSLYASFFVRFDFTIPHVYRSSIHYYLVSSIAVLVPLFYIRRLYHFTWAYVSINTLIVIFKAVSLGFLFLAFLLFIKRNHQLALNLPRSIILIDYILVFIGTSAIRVSKRLYLEFFHKKNDKRDVRPKLLIIGAGDAAEQLIRGIKQDADYPFNLVGILDDSDIKQNTNIHGIPILGHINNLPIFKTKENINSIIIATPSATSATIKNIIRLAQSSGIVKIKILPSLSEMIDYRVSIKDVRDIDVEDLLERKKSDISIKEIAQLIADKIVLITGASGSIGFELVKQISRLNPKKIIALDMDETGIFNVEQFLNNQEIEFCTVVTNILNKTKLNKIFEKYKPNLVFHSAAYKHVKLMEQNPEEAVITNILGTWNVVETASKNGVTKFIFISTDKAVHPTSVMGMTKRIAEMLIMNYATTPNLVPIAVRFGNVLGSRGSVVPLFKQQILSGGPVTITHPEMRRYLMVPMEAILLVLQAAALGHGREIFVLDMGEPVKILDLAENMIKLAGFEPYKDMPIIFTKPFSGEKLFEEIMTDTENMSSTKYKEIFITRNDNYFDRTIFFNKLDKLVTLAKNQETQKIKDMLQEFTDHSKTVQ